MATYSLVGIACWPLQVRAHRTESRFDDMLVPLLRRTLKIIVIVVGFVFIVSKVTGDVWHVLAGLSIGSLAIVLYDAEIGADAQLGDLSVVMKGETLPDGTSWDGSPARIAVAT